MHPPGRAPKTSTREVSHPPSGEGGVIKHGKQKLAVWKDDNGQPHALSATCTHKGCTVTWNNAERTWDCLCHGSMFNADGTVIHGPAVQPLSSKKVPAKRRTGA
jgi:Rieske Fe-S protein